MDNLPRARLARSQCTARPRKFKTRPEAEALIATKNVKLANEGTALHNVVTRLPKASVEEAEAALTRLGSRYTLGEAVDYFLRHFAQPDNPVAVGDAIGDAVVFALADCNNFYCSCERVFQPELRGRPVVVLSNNNGCAIAMSDEGSEERRPRPAQFCASAERVKCRRGGNWWANLATLWGGIGDSLFGFRVYPIREPLEILDSIRTARRFDFDTELAVRLDWAGVRPVNLPVPVTYPDTAAGGVTHFRYLRDNLLLVTTHTRLFFGMLGRLPRLLRLRHNHAA